MVVSLIVVLLALMFTAIVGGAIYYAGVSQKRNRAERQDLMLELGFTPVEDPGGAVASEILRLHTSKVHGRLQVQDLSKRQESECDVYLFDFVETGGASSTSGGPAQNTVAVVSSRLNLPRLSIFPKLPGGGTLAGFANRWLSHIEAGRRSMISVRDNSQFDAAYFLAGDNEADVRQVMTSYVMDHLATKPYRHIEAGGDIFTYDRTILGPSGLDPSGRLSKQQQASERLAEALEIFGLLRSRP